MRSITETRIHVGLEAPVHVLQITDIHLTFANAEDTPEHQELMRERRTVFEIEGEPAPAERFNPTPEEYFKEAIKIAEAEGMLLVNTGDAYDVHTRGNVQKFHEIADGHDMMFSPGGHEHQFRIVRTMEEGYAYVETVREQLKYEFPEFNMDFSSRVINGLNIICANNALDYYNKYTVDCFKRELERGLPIVVFSHDPIWDKLLCLTKPYHPNVFLKPEDYATNSEMIDLLLHHPLVIATFAGHGHTDIEREIDGKTHYQTAGLFKGICRHIIFD